MLAVLCVAAVVSSVAVALPAHAATAPVVTNPGSQASGTALALTMGMSASGGTTPYKWSATVLPSTAESFGMVITESLASGTLANRLIQNHPG